MDYEKLGKDLEALSDLVKAEQMQKYMRNQFSFLGISTPQRRKVCKPYFQMAQKTEGVDFAFTDLCWANPYREFQYVAVDYLKWKDSDLNAQDIPKLKSYVTEKSWWDTVDGLDQIIGTIAQIYPEVNATLLSWSQGENIWLRRVAIDHQLYRKDQTNTELFEEILQNSFGTKEFFINKAIGWSLREYSKTNPTWVASFIERFRERMAPLSIKEASKYLNLP